MPDATIDLTPGQIRYVAGVLRLQNSDEIRVFDGNGNEFMARIIIAERKQVTLQLRSKAESVKESPLTLELGQVISRGDRMDYAIQKSVELGVNSITPLYSERCEVKLNPAREEKRKLHWQSVVYSACEQCGRAFVPRIKHPMPMAQWVEMIRANLKFVLHPEQDAFLTKRITSQPLPPAGMTPQHIAVLIGPEGGLTSTEVRYCSDFNFRLLTLGPRTLRTETAPVVALTWLQQRWGDLSHHQ